MYWNLQVFLKGKILMMEKVRNYLDQKIQQGRNEIPGLPVIVMNDPRDGEGHAISEPT